MVIERRISKRKFILAVILASLVFSLGFSLGLLLESFRISKIERTEKIQELNYISLQLQYLYLNTIEDENQSCLVLDATLKKTVQDLAESLDTFIKYEEQARFDRDSYSLAGRRYLIDNLRYWMISRRTKEKCKSNIAIVLYFFSSRYCTECPNQGTLLSFYKAVFGEKLLVFPIDVDYAYQEPMVDILIYRYNITSYPTLIISEQKYEGIIGKDDLKELICNSFIEEPLECQSN